MAHEKLFAVLGCLSGFVAVAAGAFAAHGLRQKLSPEGLAVFETGARYGMYHALALIGLAWALGRWPSASLDAAGWLFVAGTVLFSGSLYSLSLTGMRWLGAVTPIGGAAFLLGWLLFAWGVYAGAKG
jgi:uncharacterized membrane protein YgdD (TMEM256/DUF423 family)